MRAYGFFKEELSRMKTHKKQYNEKNILLRIKLIDGTRLSFEAEPNGMFSYYIFIRKGKEFNERGFEQLEEAKADMLYKLRREFDYPIEEIIKIEEDIDYILERTGIKKSVPPLGGYIKR